MCISKKVLMIKNLEPWLRNLSIKEAVPDLYKTEDYADDLENNYALTAEKHYYKVSYDFDGTIF
jgi:hypothetical protein